MIYFDLKEEAKLKTIGNVVARDIELRRVGRTLQRQYNNNVLLIGASGTGRSALMEGFAYQASMGLIKGFEDSTFAKLDNGDFKKLLDQLSNPEVFAYLQAAMNSLPKGTVLFIDDFENAIPEGRLQEVGRVFETFFSRSDLSLFISVNERKLQRLFEEAPGFFQHLEEIRLKESDAKETKTIVHALSPAFMKEYEVVFDQEITDLVVEQAKRMGGEKKFPLRALHFLDETLAHAKIQGKRRLERSDVLEIFAEKTGIPTGQLSNEDIAMLQNLEDDLGQNLIGQQKAVQIVSDVIRRARMGLRNPNRPLGSFLFLGPSGVGKTELAKLLAKKVYGSERHFTRIDMSEFGEQHTVQRLIGAPPGYVGFEAGGQLTNAVKHQPYSLVLLDEIEKANPRIFDIFLQVFEDGRLSDGQGQVVDFTNAIVIATSNIGISEIVEAYTQNALNEDFEEKTLFPILQSHFRTEFLNRFDAIIVFNPLSTDDLLKVAYLEIKKIEARTANHEIKFNIDPKILKQRIDKLIDYRLGARPVKRFIEQTCESLIAAKLLNKNKKQELKP
jgi:ATP-dependent Clp protease ATP-binding subunit ClpC